MRYAILLLLILGITLQLGGCRLLSYDEEAEPTATRTESTRTPEPRREELEELEERLNTTDLGIDVSVHPDPAHVNEQIAIVLDVVNHGPNPASQTRVVYHLPDGVTYISSSADCHESSALIVTCDLHELLARDAVTVTIELTVEEGAPTTIRSVAHVENLAGPDPNPDNNSTTIDVQIRQ